MVEGHHTDGIAIGELSSEFLQRFAAAPREFFRFTRIWMKDQPNLRVGIIPAEVPVQSNEWCLKEKVVENWWVWLVSRFFSLRGRNAFRQGTALYRANVSTPRPLAYVCRREWGKLYEYLLTDAVSSSLSLDHWIESEFLRCSPTGRWDLRRHLVRELAVQLQRLHAAGLDHRDLKPTNILVSVSSDRPVLWLIDLEGVWEWPVIPRIRAVQNLARLWAGVAMHPAVTSTDAIRFLKCYLGPDASHRWKEWARLVSARAEGKIRELRARKAMASPVPLPITIRSPVTRCVLKISEPHFSVDPSVNST